MLRDRLRDRPVITNQLSFSIKSRGEGHHSLKNWCRFRGRLEYVTQSSCMHCNDTSHHFSKSVWFASISLGTEKTALFVAWCHSYRPFGSFHLTHDLTIARRVAT